MNRVAASLRRTSVFALGTIKQVHSTSYRAKQVTENVPALGESITEGSIASWVKSVGDKVSVDDVIAIVETDKVTVDIKSSFSGTLMKQLATDTVIVGDPLYIIETDDGAPFKAAENTIHTPQTKKEEHMHGTTSAHRTPLIKFVGKRDHTKLLSKKQAADMVPVNSLLSVKASAAPPAQPTIERESVGVHFTTLKDKGFYGRPKFSQKEIEAIESGGAM